MLYIQFYIMIYIIYKRICNIIIYLIIILKNILLLLLSKWVHYVIRFILNNWVMIFVNIIYSLHKEVGSLSNFSEGYIGKLRFRKSGKVELVLGDNVLTGKAGTAQCYQVSCCCRCYGNMFFDERTIVFFCEGITFLWPCVEILAQSYGMICKDLLW